MKVKVIAPGVLPGDHIVTDMETVPRKGDVFLIGRGNISDWLSVNRVIWAH